MDSNDLDSELQSLRSFYADLDVNIVDAAWEQSGHDYKVAMEELAEVVKSPTAAAKLMRRDAARDSSSSWDLTSMAASLSVLGQSVSEQITVIADNISDFVADLASAFDAGWDTDGQGVDPSGRSEAGPSTSPRDIAVVMHGGMESQRTSNRRQQASTTFEKSGHSQSMVADEEPDQGWEEDDKKYA
ncbi:hypothetical protein CEUSTIGMA_g1643.t1 [Chlamydomonas eustigma]|uniref:Uncharacterized protein n=1 Tax=Chlamydomonas eustigma TaxID=1157962 RepID=A0A250WTP2_9CHLO|nr:hypothetical protein CEUSTIGMA_g1643.t1 [Chlamydomonas eustigma]|eukprot:GAX74194.1 hypothetical protein CEUSTIGMA_g1643.t1 [Chlamydomonas eustigma]